MTFKASPQQAQVLAFVESGRGNAFIQAVAGAGKTTTLIQACKRMSGSISFAAYNTKIAKEINAKLEKEGIDLKKCRAGTFHSFGFGAWRRAYPQVQAGPQADRDKWDTIFTTLGVDKQIQTGVRKLAGYAKGRALFPDQIRNPQPWWDMVEHHALEDELEFPDMMPQVVDKAMEALELSIRLAPSVIDFDDMIYMPVISGVRIWENDWLLVDEAQDTNPARRMLARRMLRRTGRALFVGDERQAIYGFTGADADAVDQIKREFGCQELPLTVTYRCPKAVVREANIYVSHIEAHPDAPEGYVERMDLDQLMEEGPAGMLEPTDAILCRNTRPLVALAYAIIRKGMGCKVEGKDIGAGLKSLLRKWKAKQVPSFLAKLEDWTDKQVAKKKAKGDDLGAEALLDRVESLRVVCEGCQTIAEVEAKIDDLFADTADLKRPILTLSTCHKAKGREWPNVYLLGANRYMPSPYARQPWQQLQEENIMYVALTRAERALIYVNVPFE